MLSFYLSHNSLDGNNQDKVWSTVRIALQHSWSERLKFESLPSGLAGWTSSPLTPLALLKEASEIVTEQFGPEAKTKYPATIIADTEKPESLVAQVEGQYSELLKPWELYATPSAFDEMRPHLDRSVALTFGEMPDSRYGLVQFDENEHFLFAKALIGGGEEPCFYCSSRKHASSRCPSKQLFTSREGLETLGRSPLSYANDCFLNYLTSTETKIASLGRSRHADPRGDKLSLAHFAFYDVKEVFQLRFFRLFFGTDRLDWEKIRNSKDLTSQGGPTWLALDCLRVGDQDKAKYYTQVGLEHDPADWKATCLLGFLSLENDGLRKAEHHFEKALGLSRCIPQRILLNLLLARANYLSHESRKAREYARSALLLDRWCQDALYQLIVLDFDLAKNDQPLQGLERLARQNGLYWMRAFLDADLVPYGADIHPCLSRIASEVRREAETLWRGAQKEFAGVKALLGTDSKILREAQDIASSFDNKTHNEGYLHSSERLRSARILKALLQKALEEQKQGLKNELGLVRARIEEVGRITGDIKSETMPGAIEVLDGLRSRIEIIRRNATTDFAGAFQEFMTRKDAFFAQINELEKALKVWRTKRQLTDFLVAFLIRTSGFLLATFALAIMLPFLGGTIQTFAPQARISIDDYGTLQRAFIVFGVLASLIIAAIGSYSKACSAKTREEAGMNHGKRAEPVKKEIKARRR